MSDPISKVEPERPWPDPPKEEESIIFPDLNLPKTVEAEFVKPTRPELVKKILDTVRDEIKDDQVFLEAWGGVVTSTIIMFRGKQLPMSDVIPYIMNKLELPTDPNILDVRRLEVTIGNLLQEVTTQVIYAEAATKMFGERKKDLLSRGKNQKASRDLIEAALAGTDDEFRLTRGVWMSAELNHKFWVTIRTLCTDTLDRLQQIYNTLAAESRIKS
jgi:hypothetical protein